ncbi:MAG: epoxyqueuosine reductase [bacterium]|nr:epoxyqueuosine reductase [bacterium]
MSAVSKEEITAFFCRELDLPENDLGGGERIQAWDNFILGCAAGGDPLFEEFRRAADFPCYTPLELFRTFYPGAAASADELTVLCWVLPQTAGTRKDNAAGGRPAERWGRAKLYGERFYVSMGRRLEKFFAARGVDAVFPMGHPGEVKRFSSKKFYVASNWSERHACYAAGLGTFGLCDGLITPLGKAHRCGSVVIRMSLPPTPREYRDLHEYCPWFSKKSCGLCIRRCPAGALSERGHDKEKCKNFLHGECAAFFQERGFQVYACGLCQANVPCEDRIPGRKRPDLYRCFL